MVLQVDCILLARPTKSRVYFSQMVSEQLRIQLLTCRPEEACDCPRVRENKVV